MVSATFEKIKLRPLKAENAFKIFELVNINRAQFGKWLPWVKNTTKVSDTTQFIKECLRKMRDRTMFVAEIWYFNDLIGLVDLHNIDTIHRKASVGYWLCHTGQGKGIMTFAVKNIVDYGFSEFQLNRIEIMVAENNTQSSKIPVRLNFVEEGTLRQYISFKGVMQNMIIYSMLRSDWKETTN